MLKILPIIPSNVGPGLLYQNKFEHNRSLKALSIMLAYRKNLDWYTHILKKNYNKVINVINLFYKTIFKNFYDAVILLIWYKMMHKFSYEDSIYHSRSKIRALYPTIIGKSYLEPNYITMLIYSLKVIKAYTKCSIIAVVMDIILSIIGNFLKHFSKHNR